MSEWTFVLAATVRFTRNLALAEVAAQDAWAGARADDSLPQLVGAAREAALHRLRRDLTWVSELPLLSIPDENRSAGRGDVVRDDRRTLAYLLCHPALPISMRIALMRGFMDGASTPDTSDASNLLRAANAAYETPTDMQYAARVQPVLALINTNKESTCYASKERSSRCASWQRSPAMATPRGVAVAMHP